MRKSHTAAMEIFSAKANGPVATEPYEAGWAREALAVIYCHEVHRRRAWSSARRSPPTAYAGSTSDAHTPRSAHREATS
jgi:hypothetical protein